MTDRDHLNRIIGKIDAEYEFLTDLPRNHRTAVWVDQLSSLKNDVLMMLKRMDTGMSIEDAAKPCKFYERIVLNN